MILSDEEEVPVFEILHFQLEGSALLLDFLIGLHGLGLELLFFLSAAEDPLVRLRHLVIQERLVLCSGLRIDQLTMEEVLLDWSVLWSLMIISYWSTSCLYLSS